MPVTLPAAATVLQDGQSNELGWDGEPSAYVLSRNSTCRLALQRVRPKDEEAARDAVPAPVPVGHKWLRSHLPRRMSEESTWTQTVFMKVFANIDQYSGRAPLRAWVSRIAREHVHQGIAGGEKGPAGSCATRI